MARTKRSFGTIRRLPSKRYQASYIGPDMARHNAPGTFTARADAEGWIAFGGHCDLDRPNHGRVDLNGPGDHLHRAKLVAIRASGLPAAMPARGGAPGRNATAGWHFDGTTAPTAFNGLPGTSTT